jgi:hypothetical protein
VDDQAEFRLRQRHPSIGHQPVEISVFGIHPIIGDPLDLGGWHTGPRHGQLPVLP